MDSTGFYETEYRIRLPSGEYKWLLDRARIVRRSADGTALKVVGVSVDIDARKRAESALRVSEVRFRSAFEFAAIGMAMVAPDGRFLRVNQALCRIVGYSADELLRADFQTITHPDDLGADLAFRPPDARWLHFLLRNGENGIFTNWATRFGSCFRFRECGTTPGNFNISYPRFRTSLRARKPRRS